MWLTRRVSQIWNLLENEDLFTHIRSSEGRYSVEAHLAEMIALLGPPPTALLDEEKRWSEVEWSHDFYNSDGKSCRTARDYFKGPFFDRDSTPTLTVSISSACATLTREIIDAFIHSDLIPNAVRLDDTVTSLDGEEKRLFLQFSRKMLQWVPEDRKPAKELLEDPWLLS